MTSTLLCAEHQGVLHVTLNRPERKNAVSSAMLDELIATLTAARARSDLRALVLRGAGGTFCAGADVKDMAGRPVAAGAADRDAKEALARGNRRFGEVMSALQAVSAPVVAVVEGSGMGGGIGFVCASDIAIALGSARDPRIDGHRPADRGAHLSCRRGSAWSQLGSRKAGLARPGWRARRTARRSRTRACGR